MLDFFDDESLRIGNILGRDASEGQKRYADGEEGLHYVGLGNGIQPHSAEEISRIVDTTEVKKTADVDKKSSRWGSEGISWP